jgi:hypothetical protein
MIVTNSLWAQLIDLPGGGFSSPQSDATQGRIRSMADDALRPDAYKNVRMDKWYGFTSFANRNAAALGVAAKFGDTYLSGFYRGNFWAGLNGSHHTYTNQLNIAFQGGSNKIFSQYNFIAQPNVFATTPNNTIGILIGVADMGFRLAFNSSYQSFKENDIEAIVTTGNPPVPTITYYKSYESVSGNLHPQLVWSMARNLTDKGIRPYAGIDLVFVNNFTKHEAYDTSVNTYPGNTLGITVANSQNYIEPRFTAGLGGYTLYSKDGFSLSADLEYAMQFRVFNNEYHYYNILNTRQTSTVNGLNVNGIISEDSYFNNQIMPLLAGSWTKDNLALRFQLRLPLIVRSTKRYEMTPNTIGSFIKDGDSVNSTMFGFEPQLRLAARWTIVPKLALNAGGRITFGNMSLTSTKGSNYTNGIKIYDFEGQTQSFGATSYALTLGITFNATDKLSFEATSGVSHSSNSNNSINVFSTGDNGLFNFTNLLVSLRF